MLNLSFDDAIDLHNSGQHSLLGQEVIVIHECCSTCTAHMHAHMRPGTRAPRVAFQVQLISSTCNYPGPRVVARHIEPRLNARMQGMLMNVRTSPCIIIIIIILYGGEPEGQTPEGIHRSVCSRDTEANA